MRFMATAYSACGTTHRRNDDRAMVHDFLLEGAEEPVSSASMPTAQLEPPFLTAVFDGVGGSVRGDLAAMKAAESLVAANISKTPLPECLDACASAVIEWQAEVELGKRALTVGAGVFISEADEGAQATLFHVGDTRVYRFREGSVDLLTYDHSLSQRFIEEAGPDAEVPPQFAHVVTKYLGGDIPMPFDIAEPQPVQAGDIFLICSDGLWEFMATEELDESFVALTNPTTEEDKPISEEAASVHLRPGEFELLAGKLGQQAKDNGSGDDVTLVLLACYE